MSKAAKAKARPKVTAKRKAAPKPKAKAKAKPRAKPTAKPKAKAKPKAAKHTPAVEIDIQAPLWDSQPAAARTVRAAIAAAAALSTSGGEVSILLTDDSAVRVLNRDWRGIDKPTNVLSFPAPENLSQGAAGILGDIVIAYETLTRECADEDRDFLHHLAHLTVHGYLHLVGYDHQNDKEAGAMEALESRIMTRMKLPDPWHDIDRKSGNA
jgi:probable rRNA maturation factor